MTARTGRELNALNRSTMPCTCVFISFAPLAKRRSNCAYPFSYSRFCGTTLMVAVPVQVSAAPHAARFRPSEGAMLALGYTKFADEFVPAPAVGLIPGYTCIVALVWTSHGRL